MEFDKSWLSVELEVIFLRAKISTHAVKYIWSPPPLPPPPTLKWYFFPRAQTFSVYLSYKYFCLLSNCHGNISCVHILVIWILGRCTYDMKLIISHLQTNVCTRHLVLHNTMYSITSFYTYATARVTWCLQSTEISMA